MRPFAASTLLTTGAGVILIGVTLIGVTLIALAFVRSIVFEDLVEKKDDDQRYRNREKKIGAPRAQRTLRGKRGHRDCGKRGGYEIMPAPGRPVVRLHGISRADKDAGV